MNIKHFAFFAILLLFCGCKSEKPTYNNENNKVVFAQSSYTFGVVNDEEWFEVPIVATSAMAHNQNMGVEVVAAESSAIEDMHFEMESHTVTIKEGERSSYVRIRGIAEAITPNEPMIVKLNLIMGDKSVNTTYVTLQRCCEFDINNFAGYAVVTSHISSKYLPGILIGYTSDIKIDANNLTKSGYITPIVDFENIQYVFVITERKIIE